MLQHQYSGNDVYEKEIKDLIESPEPVSLYCEQYEAKGAYLQIRSRHFCQPKSSGPSCSKLTTSLVNDSLKFTSSDMQICCNFLLKKRE